MQILLDNKLIPTGLTAVAETTSFATVVIEKITKFACSTFSVISAGVDYFLLEHSEIIHIIHEARKIAVIFLISVPFVIYDAGEKLIKFILEAYHYCRDSKVGDLFNAALESISSFGTLLEQPGAIVCTINLFGTKEVIENGICKTIEVFKISTDIWAGVLSSIAAAFSIASIVQTSVSYSETKDLVASLDIVKSQAMLKRLKTVLEKGTLPAIELMNQDKRSELLAAINCSLDPNNIDQLPAIAANLIQELRSDPNPETVQMLKEIKLVGKQAYLDCLKGCDKEFLKKHITLEGDIIVSGLNAIDLANSPGDAAAKIKMMHKIITQRIDDKQRSDIKDLVVKSVSLVASIIFSILNFGITCSPLAPIAWVLTGGVIIYTIYRYVRKRYENKDELEEKQIKEMKLNLQEIEMVEMHKYQTSPLPED